MRAEQVLPLHPASPEQQPSAHPGARGTAPEPLLLAAKDLARLLSISEATLWRWDSAGKLPAGLKLGGAKRWRRAEIEAWVAAGCPDRRVWQALVAAGKGGATR